MKTVKAKCYVYDVRNHKGEWVEKEIVISPEPKPRPSPEEVWIKKICETILQISDAVNTIAKKESITVTIDVSPVKDYLSYFNKKYGQSTQTSKQSE